MIEHIPMFIQPVVAPPPAVTVLPKFNTQSKKRK